MSTTSVLQSTVTKMGIHGLQFHRHAVIEFHVKEGE